jgi:hypothetical protein
MAQQLRGRIEKWDSNKLKASPQQRKQSEETEETVHEMKEKFCQLYI